MLNDECLVLDDEFVVEEFLSCLIFSET